MGKIIKEPRFVDAKYVVDIPRGEGADADVLAEPAERGAEYYLARPSSNGHGERLALPPQPEPVPAPSIDWEQVRADAEAIIDRTATDAQQLVRQAESSALELVAGAQARVAQIEAEARRAGDAQGRIDGKSAAEAQLAPVIATMREMIESVRAQRAAAVAAAEPEVVRLALAVAERVIHTEVQTNPNVVTENVRQALTRLVSREVVTLRVNPIDLDTIRQHRDEIVAAGDVEHLRIVEDQRVDRGGVLVETEAGTIDAKIATQLREARRAILNDGEDGIALGDAEMLHSPAQAS